MAATPAGPCATYPGDDTWTATPFADGVVLIGDAAGHNDPIIGEGLSISIRDARSVRDLVVDGARKPADFAPYAEERVERMRRLRLRRRRHRGGDGGGRLRQPGRPSRGTSARGWRRWTRSSSRCSPALFAGPETIPAELVDEGILDRIRTA